MFVFRNLCDLKACFLGCIGAILFSYSASADVCFLPNGGCVALDSLYSQTIGGDDEDCSGYSSAIKGQGWDCSNTCQAHGHTYYKCTPKNCGAGYQAGITSCDRGYMHEYEKDANGKYVYSGDLKCGICVAPDECPDGTQLSEKCSQSGFKTRTTQYYVEANVCYVCLDDNCKNGKKKYCSWSSGSKDGPSGSIRAKSDEWYKSTARTQYGSICYECCNNICTRGSQEVTSCNPDTELLRTLEYTDCGSSCNECCNNVCSNGSKNPSCGSGKHKSEVGSTDCGNKCYTCADDEVEDDDDEVEDDDDDGGSSCTSKGSNLSFGSECCPDTNDSCAASEHDTWCNGSAIGRSCMNKGGTYKCVECTSSSDCSDGRTCNSSGECIWTKACPTNGGGSSSDDSSDSSSSDNTSSESGCRCDYSDQRSARLGCKAIGKSFEWCKSFCYDCI